MANIIKVLYDINITELRGESLSDILLILLEGDGIVIGLLVLMFFSLCVAAN